jgi:alcohol dehydrogenase class IV
LPKVHDNHGDLKERTDMADAATLAGQAFANAFVGTNHALAHAVGARFGIAHGGATSSCQHQGEKLYGIVEGAHQVEIKHARGYRP